MKIIYIITLFLYCTDIIRGQDSSSTFGFSGYVESYYALDANRPAANRRPVFLYSHNRNNEFNLNLGFLKGTYHTSNVRANIALATGTYMADNYAAEPSGLRNILEANAGLKLGKRTWLDIGIMPSHIGFESAVLKDCWTLTRSIVAENSPYYEAGAKITCAPNEEWTFSALMLNGWQRIARVNTTPAFGTQLTWKPNMRSTLNWSTYIGNERLAGEQALWRFYNDFYGIFQLTEKIGLMLGFDIGLQKSAQEGNDVWFTPNAVLRAQLHDKWSMAARIEHFRDESGVIIRPDFSISGASVNLDFLAAKNAVLRLETRYLYHKNALFATRNGSTSNMLYGTASLAVSF